MSLHFLNLNQVRLLHHHHGLTVLALSSLTKNLGAIELKEMIFYYELHYEIFQENQVLQPALKFSPSHFHLL